MTPEEELTAMGWKKRTEVNWGKKFGETQVDIIFHKGWKEIRINGYGMFQTWETKSESPNDLDGAALILANRLNGITSP